MPRRSQDTRTNGGFDRSVVKLTRPPGMPPFFQSDHMPSTLTGRLAQHEWFALIKGMNDAVKKSLPPQGLLKWTQVLILVATTGTLLYVWLADLPLGYNVLIAVWFFYLQYVWRQYVFDTERRLVKDVNAYLAEETKQYVARGFSVRVEDRKVWFSCAKVLCKECIFWRLHPVVVMLIDTDKNPPLQAAPPDIAMDVRDSLPGITMDAPPSYRTAVAPGKSSDSMRKGDDDAALLATAPYLETYRSASKSPNRRRGSNNGRRSGSKSPQRRRSSQNRQPQPSAPPVIERADSIRTLATDELPAPQWSSDPIRNMVSEDVELTSNATSVNSVKAPHFR